MSEFLPPEFYSWQGGEVLGNTKKCPKLAILQTCTLVHYALLSFKLAFTCEEPGTYHVYMAGLYSLGEPKSIKLPVHGCNALYILW